MFFNLSVEKMEDDKAILKDEQGELYVWPKVYLPKDIAIGQTLVFNIFPKNNSQHNENQLAAQSLLDEIL